MDNCSIARLAGNVADWLLIAQGLSAEEIAAVGEALRRHAACLRREAAHEPEAASGALPVMRPKPDSTANPLNN